MRLSNFRSPARTARAGTALVAVAALALAGCSGDADDEAEGAAASSSPTASASESESASPSASPSETASQEPTEEASTKPTKKPSKTPAPTPVGPVVEVTVQGDRVSPQAEVLEADIDKPITLEIQSDRAGEMHVHSSPEQYVDFGPGRTTAELRFENPGAIDVEEHESGALVLKILVQ